MIFDCFTFYNEHDVLEMRLTELYEKVDKFILVEGNKTHSGQPKQINFDITDQRWAPFRDKLVNGVVDMPDIPDGRDRWFLENFQRNAIFPLLYTQNPTPYDAVIVSDVDEIPDLSTWNGREGVFVQKHSFYNFDWVMPEPWNGSVLLAFGRMISPFGQISPQDMRNFRDLVRPCGTGWHFSWLGNEESAKHKMSVFAHDELEKSGTDIALRIQSNQHPEGKQLVYCRDYLPTICNKFPQYFKGNKDD